MEGESGWPPDKMAKDHENFNQLIGSCRSSEIAELMSTRYPQALAEGNK